MFLKNSNSKKSASQTAGRDRLPSVIVKGMHILGNIIDEDGTIDMDGTLDGNIRCAMLTIRANGVVKGEIQASHVLVYGKINGLIKAKQVSLFAGCRIEGIVMHEQLSIEDGAFIDGKLKRMDRLASEDTEGDDEASDSEKHPKMLENIRLIR